MKRLAVVLRHAALAFEHAGDMFTEGSLLLHFVGSDPHKTSSQICVLSEDSEFTERRINSIRASFDKVLADMTPTRILIGALTKSERVASHLEGLGH